MSVDEASQWPDPESMDGISLLPPTDEATSARAALDATPDADDAFGADSGDRDFADPDDGWDAEPDITG
jgi:hypothetical protein